MSRFFSLTSLVLAGMTALSAGLSAQSPADDVTTQAAGPLQSTQYGIRLTPEMARGMSRLAIQHNLAGELGLSDTQVEALSASSARHLMEMGHAQGDAIGGIAQYFIQSMMRSGGRFDPDTAREFAERTLPVMPAYNKMLNDFTDDAGRILSDQQLSDFQDWMKHYRQEVQAFETRMNRWKSGGAQEGENPFAPSAVAEERPEREKDEPAANRSVRRARRYAQWEERRLGPTQWKRFLTHAQRFFEFSEAQTAQAHALLTEYTERCDALMTDDWRARFEKNRILSRMQWTMRDLARGPWAYHIDREYEELVLPIEKLGDAFREDVMALVNEAQRDHAVQPLREKARLHGMEQETWSEMESALRSITPAATQASGELENRGS